VLLPFCQSVAAVLSVGLKYLRKKDNRATTLFSCGIEPKKI